MNSYQISTDRTQLNTEFIFTALNTTYWAAGRSREVIEKSLAGSLCFGVYAANTRAQVGFARVVTDRATFAWICDVYVDPAHRAQGLASA